MLKRFRGGVSAVLLVLTVATAAQAQTTYTFKSGSSPGDGFMWPTSPPGISNSGFFETPDGVGIVNQIGNQLFIDDNYMLPVSPDTGLTDEALWGNPKPINPFSEVVQFNDIPASQSVTFDFAWAIAGQNPPDELEVYVDDIDGNGGFVYVPLDSFEAGGAFGGFDGYGGQVHLDIDDLADQEGFFLNEIAMVHVFLEPISDPGGIGEFAFDNFSIDGGGGGVPDGGPDESDVFPVSQDGQFEISGIGTNWLTTAPLTQVQFAFDVKNDGTGSTTVTVSLDGTSDPEFAAGAPITMEPIGPGEVVPTGLVGTLASNNTPGVYQATATVTNDLNPGDDDEVLPFTVTLYDAPDLTDDTGTTVDPAVNGDIFIANAASALPRAGVEVTGFASSIPGLIVSGIGVGDSADPGGSIDGQVETLGLLSGSYNGTFQVDLKMNSTQNFLNGAQPVAARVWNLDFAVGDTLFDGVDLMNGDLFGKSGLGINNGDTAVTLIGGVSNSDQNLDLGFAGEPSGDATVTVDTTILVGSQFDLTFDGAVGGMTDLYVMQVTYDEALLPVGSDELGMRILYFDTGSSLWEESVLFNSDGGAGEQFFEGSYAAFLASIGDPATPPLSAQGVDVVNNHIWAVLDHNTLFSAGLVPEPASALLIVSCLPVVLGRRRR